MPLPPRRIPLPPPTRSNRSSSGTSPSSNPTTITVTTTINPAAPMVKYIKMTPTPKDTPRMTFPTKPVGKARPENKLRPGMYAVKKCGGPSDRADLEEGVEEVLRMRFGGGEVEALEGKSGRGDVEQVGEVVGRLSLGQAGGEPKVVGLAELVESGRGKNRPPRQPIAQSLGFSLVLSPANNVLALPDDDTSATMITAPSDDKADERKRRSLGSSGIGRSLTIGTSGPTGLADKLDLPGTMTRMGVGAYGTTPELSTSFGTPGSEGAEDEDEDWENVSGPMDEDPKEHRSVKLGGRELTSAHAAATAEDDDNEGWIGIEDDVDEEIMFFQVDGLDGRKDAKSGAGKQLSVHRGAMDGRVSYARALRPVE